MLPSLVGRFVVLDRIGEHDDLLRAYDPELDRRVAVKLLPPELLADARALARLSHPNVVTIHEVGAGDGQAFLAMEYVPGVDLARWMQTHPVGTAARFTAAMRLLQGAGSGLAAAHAIGVLHRDLSPSKILIRDDDQAKLAPPSALVGPPSHRPPADERPDARSDQFSFCVVAWELLFGVLPWTNGPPDGEPHAPDGAPRHAVAVLSRGLALDPALRHPDMNALLTTLARDPRRQRRSAIAVVAAVVVAGTAVAAVARERATMCDDGPQAFAQTWNEPRRAALAEHFASFGISEANDVWQRADARLLSLADEWLATWSSVCDAGRRRHELAQETTDSAIACLELRRVELEANLATLENAERELASQATNLIHSLLSPRACAERGHDAEAVQLPQDPEERAELLRAWQDIAAVRMIVGLGEPTDALAQIETLEASVNALGSVPLQLRVADLRINAMINLADMRVAKIAEDAYWTALRHGEDAMAAKFARRLGSAALRESDVENAAVWIEYARALGDRAGVGDDERSRVEVVAARFHVESGDLVAAKECMERALRFGESAWGDDHPDMTSVYNGLTIVHRRLHEYEAAVDAARKALEIDERTLGPTAMNTADSLENLASSLSLVGRPDEAIAMAERVVRIRSAWLGDDHVEVGSALLNLGVDAWQADRRALAIDALRRAVAIYRQHYPPEHERRLLAENNLAGALRDDGQLDEALAIQIPVVRGYERLPGGERPRLAMALHVLGTIHTKMRDFDSAVAALERAYGIYDKLYGRKHPRTLEIRIALADLELLRDRPQLALDAVARMLPDLTGPETSVERGLALSLEGQALDRLGRRQDAVASLDDALPLVVHRLDRIGILRHRAKLLRELGRTEAAEADARLGLQEAQAIDDTAAIAAFNALLR